jgi:MarR family transcriptional regulator for hemolysin
MPRRTQSTTQPAQTRPARDNLGFLLAKASQRWNELLAERFVAHGFPEVRPAYGSILIPLYEEDGLRMGELARRSRLSKQSMTQLIRRLERDGLAEMRPDPGDGRATLVFLTPRARAFAPVAAEVLAALDDKVAAILDARELATIKGGLSSLIELDGGSQA